MRVLFQPVAFTCSFHLSPNPVQFQYADKCHLCHLHGKWTFSTLKKKQVITFSIECIGEMDYAKSQRIWVATIQHMSYMESQSIRCIEFQFCAQSLFDKAAHYHPTVHNSGIISTHIAHQYFCIAIQRGFNPLRIAVTPNTLTSVYHTSLLLFR